MLRKAVSKYTIAFLAGFLLTVGIIIIVIVIPGLTYREICPKTQEEHIRDIWLKIEEMKGRPGYQIVYFKVEDCVEYITYKRGKKLEVKYITVKDPVSYDTNADWLEDGNYMKLMKSGNYLFRVFEDKVEVLR